MIKQIRLRSRNNILTKAIFEKYFDENYKSVVVLANPKTVVNMKFAKKEVKDKIIKVDQLNAHIKELVNISKSPAMSDKEMKEAADFFLENSTPNTKDYRQKCKLSLDDNGTITTQVSEKNNMQYEIIENTPLYKALKDYRFKQSQKEKIKPYFIYNNAQLEEIIKCNPKTLDELKKLNGFCDVKCQKYGKDILLILGDYK